jgi:DNA repair protein RadD
MGAQHADRQIPLPAANLIIIDEAHHVGARTWRLILEAYPNARRIGLTATPCRSDGRGLGNYFDELILGPQIPELIAQKHLVPTIYYAPVEPDLKGVETRQGDYAINQLADRMNRDDLVGESSATGTSTANAGRPWCLPSMWRIQCTSGTNS